MVLPAGGGEEFDPRAHRSFIVPGYEIESLASNDKRTRGPLTALLWEAEVFADEELRGICYRNMTLHAADKAQRAQLMADVARSEEALQQHHEAEARVRQAPEV